MTSAWRWGAVPLFLALAAPAAAQGKGHAYGHSKKGATPPAASAEHLQIPGTGVRNFGSWLDDASMLPVGTGTVAISFGYWRTDAFRELDMPAADASFGLAPRVAVGVSIPFYHATQPGSPMMRGIGDLFLNAKVQIREASEKTLAPGLAVTPVIEVLSAAPIDGSSRYSWGLPVSLELQRAGWRAFGSAGYFSRGSLFASGAVEVALNDRTYVTGSISRSHSLHEDELSTAMGLARTRTDVSGSLSRGLTDTLSIFGGVGRTISARDPNSTTLTLTGGAAFSFRR